MVRLAQMYFGIATVLIFGLTQLVPMNLAFAQSDDDPFGAGRVVTGSSGQKPDWVGNDRIVTNSGGEARDGGLNLLADIASNAPTEIVQTEWHQPRGRYWYDNGKDLPIGTYRLRLEKLPDVNAASAGNHDMIHVYVHFSNNDNIHYKMAYGKNGMSDGRVGYFAIHYPEGATMTKWTRWGPTLTGQNYSRSEDIGTQGELILNVSKPTRIYVETIRSVGSTFKGSGNNRRTNFSNVREFGLPLEAEYGGGHLILKGDYWHGPVDYGDFKIRIDKL